MVFTSITMKMIVYSNLSLALGEKKDDKTF